MAEGEEVVLVQVNATDGSSLRHVRELIFEYTQASKVFFPAVPLPRNITTSPHRQSRHSSGISVAFPQPAYLCRSDSPISADQTPYCLVQFPSHPYQGPSALNPNLSRRLCSSSCSKDAMWVHSRISKSSSRSCPGTWPLLLRNPLSSSIYGCTCTIPFMSGFPDIKGQKVLKRFLRTCLRDVLMRSRDLDSFIGSLSRSTREVDVHRPVVAVRGD
jgi:hypothetical protein